RRTLPTICSHMCNVSRVSIQPGTSSSGHAPTDDSFIDSPPSPRGAYERRSRHGIPEIFLIVFAGLTVSPHRYGRRVRTSHARHLNGIECALRELVDEVDPDAVALCEARAMWRQFDRVEREAAAAKILLARRVEEAGAWKRGGFRSAAE